MPKQQFCTRPWRAVHDSWLSSERLGAASDRAVILWNMLNTRQDDAGRFHWTPVRVLGLVALRRWTLEQASLYLADLARVGSVTVVGEWVTLHRGAELNGTPTAGSKDSLIPRFYPGYTDGIPTVELNHTEGRTTEAREETKREETNREEKMFPQTSFAPTSTTPGKKQKTMVPVWTSPDWFQPLTLLQGYKPADYGPSAAAIADVCARRGVDPAAVVTAFVALWPRGVLPRGEGGFGWKSPVLCLVRTMDTQINKLSAPPSPNGNSPPRTSRVDKLPDRSEYGKEGQW